jgi:hypothetical protein
MAVVRVAVDVDRHAAEALRIELVRLARRYGLEPAESRVESGRGAQEGGRHSTPDAATPGA